LLPSNANLSGINRHSPDSGDFAPGSRFSPDRTTAIRRLPEQQTIEPGP
jgi:hypothetical protein